MNRLPDDPEAEIMQRLRGGNTAAGTPPTPDEALQEPAAESDVVPPPPDAEPPDEGEPGLAPDDQNQLQREIESPPAD
jgi:hypothetical protein